MRVDKLPQTTPLVLKELEDGKATSIANKYNMKMSGVALKGAKPMHMNREWQVRKKSAPDCDRKEVIDQIFGNGETCFFVCAILKQRDTFDFLLRIITASKGTPAEAITAYLIQTKNIGYDKQNRTLCFLAD